jgi:nitric oxide reductase NorD protein
MIWRGRFGGGRGRAEEAQAGPPPLALRAAERSLALFAAGVSDGLLTIAEGADASAYTDGRTIFLPAVVVHAPTREGNLRLYRAQIAHAAAQLRYGTLAQDDGLEALRAPGTDPGLVAALFDIVEGARLIARLTADFPGSGRDLAELAVAGLPARATPAALRGRSQALEVVARATIGAGEAALAGVRGRAAGELRALLPLLPCAAAWRELDRAASIGLARAPAARLGTPGPGATPLPLLGRSAIRLDRVRREVLLPPPPPVPEAPAPAPKPPTDAPRPAPTLVTEGRGAPPPQPREDERRPAATGGRQVAVAYADTAPQFTARLVPLTAEERIGAFIYPEWDVTTGAYRPDWVALRPRRTRAGSAEWVERTLRRRHAQVQQIKRQFEALRPERQRLRRQDDGEDLDLDVLVASHVDRRLGLPPSERPYARTREERRDIAVAFLVDLSGSTGGYVAGPRGGERVLDVAKEALTLLCEALTTLDDQHAVYGFSGATRKGCEFYTVKDFADVWDEETKQRLGGLAPLAYTRLGPPIRHTTTLLAAIPARVRLLLLLSDGRPNDFDAYGGEYGIADTRKALLEARGRGVRTFCLTIDAEAREYMPRLFGPDNYVTLSNIASLPRVLPELYRRLTVG